MKIGHGFELVVVARNKDTGEFLYFTEKRTWTKSPAGAKLFLKASDAHKTAAKAFAGDNYTISAEGTFTPAFGHN